MRDDLGRVILAHDSTRISELERRLDNLEKKVGSGAYTVANTSEIDRRPRCCSRCCGSGPYYYAYQNANA